MENDNLSNSLMEEEKKDIFEAFHFWAVQNYGDSGKTKTVTQKKYRRITKILSGEEPPTAENSKFRCWVKAKGFRLGPQENSNSEKSCLYVPTKPIVSSFIFLIIVSQMFHNYIKIMCCMKYNTCILNLFVNFKETFKKDAVQNEI
jgi:hypothetical protein